MGEFRLYIPRRIQARWVKHHNLPQTKLYSYRFDSILETAKVNANEFRKFWFFLHPTLPADEIFSLFIDSGFSPKRGDTTGKLAFVRKVLQYKNEQVFPPPFAYGHLCCFTTSHFRLFLHCDVHSLIHTSNHHDPCRSALNCHALLLYSR